MNAYKIGSKSLNADLLERLGFVVNGDTVTCKDGTRATERDVEVAAGYAEVGSVRKSADSAMAGIRTAKIYEPTEDDFAVVRSMVKGTQDVTKYGFYETILADTTLDLDNERFTKRFLDALARQYNAPGRAFLLHHDTRQIKGSTFAAIVEPIPGNQENFQLRGKFYIPDWALTDQGEKVTDLIDSGSLKFVSVGFLPFQREFIENGDSYFWQYDVKDGEREPEALELSGVYRGAQPRAAIKSIQLNDNKIMELNIEFGGAIIKTPSQAEEAFKQAGAKIKEQKETIERIEAELKAVKEKDINRIKSISAKLELTVESDEILFGKSVEDLQAQFKKLDELDTKLNSKDPVTGGDPVDPTPSPEPKESDVLF